MLHLTTSNYIVSQWSGGTTTQIAIAPAQALYADRDFLWRISSAVVELEESDFTPLGDYQRYITVLDGGMVLTHDGGASITLTPGDIHEFDGGSQTRSVGRCTDFNLMLRKGKCSGTLRSIRLSAGNKQDLTFSDMDSTLIFCHTGSGSVSAEGETVAIAPSETVVLEKASAVTLTAREDAFFILAEVKIL